MARADDIEDILLRLADEAVEMSIHEVETWAGAPMSKETRLDVIGSDVTFYERVVLQKYHC